MKQCSAVGRASWVPSILSVLCLSAMLVAVSPGVACADQVQMLNGDKYVGTVTSLTAETLVLHSEVLGTVRLPRAKVAAVFFGVAAGTNALGTRALLEEPSVGALRQTNPVLPQASAELSQLTSHTNLLRQVQEHFLSGAGPEANAKFNELINGLSTGTLSMKDLRAQAQAAADQVRAARKELGDEAGGSLDTYLAILDSFLKESAPAASPTNSAVTTVPTRQ